MTTADCSATLSAGSLSDITKSFVEGGAASATNSASFWDTTFSNTDSTNCAISSCSLWLAGQCGTTSYSGADISISGLNAYAEVDVSAGYSHDLCVRCSNG